MQSAFEALHQSVFGFFLGISIRCRDLSCLSSSWSSTEVLHSKGPHLWHWTPTSVCLSSLGQMWRAEKCLHEGKWLSWILFPEYNREANQWVLKGHLECTVMSVQFSIMSLLQDHEHPVLCSFVNLWHDAPTCYHSTAHEGNASFPHLFVRVARSCANKTRQPPHTCKNPFDQEQYYRCAWKPTTTGLPVSAWLASLA